ncbi:MAG: hypothetical protein LJF30_10550, partial [Acidobacteria bacterium]|nr:hypothetical protein [Acidobacteriota bacterium]
PYPGLESFRESDTERFFGREAEVEGLWAKLHERRLLAVIGPSGVGKTSFVRAGVLASRPTGWVAVVCAPGANPFRSLGQALAPQLADDPEALSQLVGFEDLETAVGLLERWRRSHTEALLVVDQLEELFTLSPEEEQARFAELIGRVSTEADVHVVLSMRDDFLMRCSEHDALSRVFTELTPLRPLSGDGLRRALVEPAKREGFRFEEGLVEEMLQSVEGARGALPLLAFAVSRLWQKRDREKKLLTRAAYEEIGGVAGALAQHAEATLERIGEVRQVLVREIFRNLVTAQGTRASCEREELLSAFPEPAAAETALEELIDARLLTSYEVPVAEDGRETQGPGAERRYRIEIVHESLLKAWPRLVWWQAQDEGGAQLRDQLRQAARLWEEKGRTEDLLWSGTAEREFEVWRDRYPGQLTAVEDDFATAMVGRARRHRRLRRLVATSVVVVAVAVALVTGLLWWRGEQARRRALDAARRSEAARLVALGRVELDRYPTAALAYVRKSLELADSPEARQLAVKILWRGPPARILPVSRLARELGTGEDREGISRIGLSPDGRWLATMEMYSRAVHLFPRDGGPARAVPPIGSSNGSVLGFGPGSDPLVTGGDQSLRFWSLPDVHPLRTVELDGVSTFGGGRGESLLTFTRMSRDDAELLVRAWPLPTGDPEILGEVKGGFSDVAGPDPPPPWLAFGRGRSVTLAELRRGASRLARERVLGEHRDEVTGVAYLRGVDRLASLDRAGEIRIWSLAADTPALVRVLRGGGNWLIGADPEGTHLATHGKNSSVNLWDLDRPSHFAPTTLQRPDLMTSTSGAFDPTGRWLLTGNGTDVAFWPLSGPRAEVLPPPAGGFGMAFTPDGRALVTSNGVRVWPLDAEGGEMRTLLDGPFLRVFVRPSGTHVLAFGARDQHRLALAPIDGGPPAYLEGDGELINGAFDAQGRHVVVVPMRFTDLDDTADPVLRIWDLDSGEERVFSLAHFAALGWRGFQGVRVAPDGSVYVGGTGTGWGGVHRLTLPDSPGGTVRREVVYDTGAGSARFELTPDGRHLLAWGTRKPGELNRFNELVFFDLEEGTSRRITTHGSEPYYGALDPSGRIVVSGGEDGVVRVGPATGEEPHLLFGHTGPVQTVAVSPDGRWIASASSDGVRLWPMPDVAKTPFHTLPYEELMAKLRALTNLEVVADESASTGYRVEVGPFPGWEEVPGW